MELKIHPHDDISLVALAGRLDAGGVEEIEQEFTDATSGRGLPAIVDMSGITFMSSLGIGFLFANTKKLKKAGAKLVLLNPQGMVETVLRTSKMDKVMPIFHEIEEAIQAVGGDPSLVAALAPPSAATAPTDTSDAEPEAKEAAQPPQETSTDTPDNILKLTIKNEMSELDGLYAAINQFLVRHRVPYRSGYAVNLAVEELVVNVIRYAYVDDDEHTIDIGVGVIDEQIILEIRDAGRPFDPREAPSPDHDIDDPEVGGLGLALVLDLVDALSYRRTDDKNHVQVCIRSQDEGDGALWSVTSDEASASSE